MPETVWVSRAYAYDSLVSQTNYQPLGGFLAKERELLVEQISELFSRGRQVSVVEIGCGTGRVLRDLLTSDAVRPELGVLIGVDNSLPMITLARRDRLAIGDPEDYFLFLMAGQDVATYFSEGSVDLAALQSESAIGNGQKQNLQRLEVTYHQSAKIICCLLNTVGIMRRSIRVDVLASMCRALGSGDRLVLSIFDRKCFNKHAKSLYTFIKDLTGTFTDRAFDMSRAEFRTAAYYSHWFDEAELSGYFERELVDFHMKKVDCYPFESQGLGGLFLVYEPHGHHGA